MARVLLLLTSRILLPHALMLLIAPVLHHVSLWNRRGTVLAFNARSWMVLTKIPDLGRGRRSLDLHIGHIPRRLLRYILGRLQ